MKRMAKIGLAVGLGIFGLLAAITIGMLVVHHLRTYRLRMLRVGDTYILDGVPHTLAPLPRSPAGGGLYPLLKDGIARELKAMYVDFRRVCDALEIRCWASGGTLLGWVRHRGFIPWDDDIDLHLHRDDLATLRGAQGQALLRQAGLALAWMPAYRQEILKIMRPQHRAGELRHYPFLDVLAVDTVEGELGTCGSSLEERRCGRLLQRERWREDDIFPLREETFEDVHMWLPRRPEALLRTQYGESVFQAYRVDLFHWLTLFQVQVPLPPAPEGEG
jgi:hypothetical protein